MLSLLRAMILCHLGIVHMEVDWLSVAPAAAAQVFLAIGIELNVIGLVLVARDIVLSF